MYLKQNSVSTVYIVAAVLWLQFVAQILLFPMLNILFIIIIITISITIIIIMCTTDVQVVVIFRVFWLYNCV